MPNHPLVDFHCHLDLYPDHVQAVSDCENRGIYTLAVTTTPRAWPRNHELTSATKYVRAALGLHPQLIREYAHELVLWRSYLEEARYVGEVGLDASPRFYSSIAAQKHAFETILRDCADRGDKILTIHSVRAVKVVLDMIETYFPRSRGKVVLHWFTGTKAEAERAVKLGAYFSINREMLQNDRHHQMVSHLPIDRLLTETDGPFAKIDGRNVSPADVSRTVEELAIFRAIPPPELVQVIATNLKTLISD